MEDYILKHNNKDQTYLDPFVENPDYIPMPLLFDSPIQWEKHLKQSEPDYIAKIEAAFRTGVSVSSKVWK